MAFPLEVIHSSKYYLEKEKVERRIIWGIGKGKNLLQFRLPEAISAWTGSEATPMTAHFSVPGHQKAASALGQENLALNSSNEKLRVM